MTHIELKQRLAELDLGIVGTDEVRHIAYQIGMTLNIEPETAVSVIEVREPYRMSIQQTAALRKTLLTLFEFTSISDQDMLVAEDTVNSFLTWRAYTAFANVAPAITPLNQGNVISTVTGISSVVGDECLVSMSRSKLHPSALTVICEVFHTFLTETGE